MQLKSGAILQGGRYRIVDSLGRGGFGVTYLAEQVNLHRKVCIKEFFPKDYFKRDEDSVSISLLSDSFNENMSRFKAKFVKEAQTIATLNHANIIPIHDVFEENGTAYYVMDYIEGESLSERVKRGGAMSERDAVAYIRQVASALGYIHERTINHLDVKPGNIMVREEDNRAILIDFGLSKHYDTTSGEATSTTPVGVSHGFAPMEQYQDGVNRFSPETDIYSLGATLYYLVTGSVPPSATDVGEEGLPTLPKHLSSSLCKAIEVSMSYWRKDRPQTIKAFVALLDGCGALTMAVADESTVISTVASDIEKTKIVTPQPKPQPRVEQPQPKIPIEPAPKPKRSRWWVWVLGLLLIGGVAYFLYDANFKDYRDKKETSRSYNIGDYYNENGREGVVFEVWDGGRHGKIVSLDETGANWDDANDWCQNKGKGWRLPTMDELKAISDIKSKINSTLAEYGAGLTDAWYWSSTEYENDPELLALYVYMYDGNNYYYDKTYNRYVRAVSDF